MHSATLVVAAGLLVICHGACAESWYRWKDDNGRSRVSHDHPPMGTPFVEFQMPDPIRWSNAPDMPAEIADETRVSPQKLFKLASQSVYWVLKSNSSGPLDSGAVVYGSAVAISEDLALTNCHVMAGAGEDAQIGSGDQGSVSQAILVAANYALDRCVIKSRDLQLHPIAGIRRADTLEVGESVYAIGNPSHFDRTLSDGLISGKRMIGEQRMLQTTAPISPGSSGGGLFDTRGNLVGITTSGLKNSQSINFAIPAEDFWK